MISNFIFIFYLGNYTFLWSIYLLLHLQVMQIHMNFYLDCEYIWNLFPLNFVLCSPSVEQLSLGVAEWIVYRRNLNFYLISYMTTFTVLCLLLVSL